MGVATILFIRADRVRAEFRRILVYCWVSSNFLFIMCKGAEGVFSSGTSRSGTPFCFENVHLLSSHVNVGDFSWFHRYFSSAVHVVAYSEAQRPDRQFLF